MSKLTKIFGTHSQRELKRIYPIVDKVESYRDQMVALSDEELQAKTKEFKDRLEKGETLDDLLPEAYATVREAARRVLGMEHYRVQIIGGIIPVVSEKNGRFMESEISGIHLSEEMIESYHGLEREEAEELAVKYSLLYARKMADYVDGYYLMTPFGRTGLMARIVRELKEM